MAQLHSINAAAFLFYGEYGSPPSSDANDPIGKSYCGAMRLTEALMGQDLLGFHARSVFRCDGFDTTGAVDLYPVGAEDLTVGIRDENLKARRTFLQAEDASAWRLADVYGKGRTGPFPEDTYVLCDTYIHKRPSGKKTGMPILYYRADQLGHAHQAGDPNNIFNCMDNHALLALGVPGDPNKVHPLIDPERFYLNTANPEGQPYRSDSFILISAGWDGLYGTADDIYNFKWKCEP
jgi:hypothetical protein